MRAKFSAEHVRISKSLAIRLELLIQAKVLSTTHLLARTAHPSLIFFEISIFNPIFFKGEISGFVEALPQTVEKKTIL